MKNKTVSANNFHTIIMSVKTETKENLRKNYGFKTKLFEVDCFHVFWPKGTDKLILSKPESHLSGQGLWQTSGKKSSFF